MLSLKFSNQIYLFTLKQNIISVTYSKNSCKKYNITLVHNAYIVNFSNEAAEKTWKSLGPPPPKLTPGKGSHHSSWLELDLDD